MWETAMIYIRKYICFQHIVKTWKNGYGVCLYISKLSHTDMLNQAITALTSFYSCWREKKVGAPTGREIQSSNEKKSLQRHTRTQRQRYLYEFFFSSFCVGCVRQNANDEKKQFFFENILVNHGYCTQWHGSDS